MEWMEMRAIEDTAIAEDLTPPLLPLASALHDSSLTTHCSACFSPLPPPPHLSTTTSSVLYCSPHCSSLDSPLHFSSSEHHLLSLSHQSTSDLRLALRLLHKLSNSCNKIGRIAGLMTNYEMLMSHECGEEDESFVDRIRDGAKAMAAARRVRFGEDVSLDLLEMVLCLVMTNAVEVQDSESGCSIGVAVYGTAFSWINHSCSPSACYRFAFGTEHYEPQRLRIFSSSTESVDINGQCGYGPRVILRSIKALSRGEEVTIAYTDLLQPKEIRQAELWFKYRFKCCCKRCSVVPATYVDRALQATSTTTLEFPGMISDHRYIADEEIEKLMEDFDDAITDYLSFNDPKLCCEKLENLLSNGTFDCQAEPKTSGSHQKLKLHLFHHISINAYMTLASAYNVRASDMIASGTSEHNLQAFSMCKLSAAYSLLLAGVTHHLYISESSLIASAASFWINAGESLLSLARTLWGLDLSSNLDEKCQDCFSTENSVHQLDERSRQQSCCTASLSSRVWSKLNLGSSFLKQIQNPIDFCWIKSAVSLTGPEDFSRDHHCEQLKRDVVNLNRHCLRYGSLLSSICGGSPLSAEIQYVM